MGYPQLAFTSHWAIYHLAMFRYEDAMSSWQMVRESSNGDDFDFKK